MINSASIGVAIQTRRTAKRSPGATTAYLVLDTESVPDGDLIRRLRYPNDDITPDEAIARAQAEMREQSPTASEFLPVTLQYPVAVCVLKVADDFTLQNLACLDAPQFRTEEIVRQFWRGVELYPGARIVSFNGRGFDLPLLELAAYDYGFCARDYFINSRNRFQGKHLDLMDWLSNFGAYRLTGGLDLLSKRLHGDDRKRLLGGLDGPPGKAGIAGDQVHAMYRAGRLQEINDYCLCDTLDTYFIFLRTRVVTGDISRDQLRVLVRRALEWLEAKAETMPAVAAYLQHWKPESLRLARVMEMPSPAEPTMDMGPALPDAAVPAVPDEAASGHFPSDTAGPMPATAPAIPGE
jgi:predicted PolB exonuclease-like 3'-5' exonuclease